jgi:hypothetical protein
VEKIRGKRGTRDDVMKELKGKSILRKKHGKMFIHQKGGRKIIE